eukprot:m51a1_g2422 hypothetical protein (424) ;mRNA; f:809935-811390
MNKELYEHIIAQLQADGYGAAAGVLSEATQIYFPAGRSGSSALSRIFERGRRSEGESCSLADSASDAARGLSLDPVEGRGTAYCNYITKFITTHKNICKVASFNASGTMVATGSADTSLKILDVERMKAGTKTPPASHDDADPNAEPAAPPHPTGKSVVRTYYDHTQPVNDVQFHPTMPWLASASRDGTVRFYDLKSAARRSSRTLRDASGVNVRSLSFHPSGDFLLVGTDDPVLRLYDVATLACYSTPSASDNHTASVSQVSYGALGNMFATASKDGTAKVWDGVSGKCVRTQQSAHGGEEVCSARLSMSQRYLLTSGKDGTVKLWDVGTGKELRSHVANHGGQKHRLQAVFTWNEEIIVGCEERGMCAVLWDAHSGTIVQRLTGHTAAVRWVASSSAEPGLVTCSNDYRARFWIEAPTQKD